MSVLASWVLTVTVFSGNVNAARPPAVAISTIPETFETEAACKVAGNRYRNAIPKSVVSGSVAEVIVVCMTTDDPTTAR